MSSVRRVSVLVLAGLALATAGCTETDLGLKARKDVKRLDQDVQRQAGQINRGLEQSGTE